MSVLKNASSEYTLYGKESGISYAIVRHGLKGNSFSENLETYLHWQVVENRVRVPLAKVLTNPKSLTHKGGWVHIMAKAYKDFYYSKDFYFETAEDALAHLESCLDETLVTQ